jgi:hypothetical protein
MLRPTSLLVISLASLASCGLTPAPDDAVSPPQGERSTVDVFRAAHGEFVQRATSEPFIQVTALALPGAELENEPGEFDLAHWALDAIAPIPLSRDSFLLVGALAGQRIYQFDGVPTIADETLHSYGLRLGFGKFLNDDLAVQGYWEPSVYSDLDGTLHGEDYRLWYARALATWRANDELYWKAGFMLNDAADTGALPLFGFTWHFASGWRIDALFPRDAKVSWTPSERWVLSTGVRLDANEYHIRGPASIGSPEHDVHAQELYAYVGAERMLDANLSAFMRLGMSIAGNYDWSYGTGAPDYDAKLEPAPFALVGIGWRF